MKKIIVFLVVVVGLFMLPVDSQAGNYRNLERFVGHIKERLYQRIELLLENQKKLELTEEQAEKLVNLKNETEKDQIVKDAQIETISIDIKAKVWADLSDVEGIYKLIDQQYELRKQKDKALVNAYVILKEILTAAQEKEMKVLWKESMQSPYGSHWGSLDSHIQKGNAQGECKACQEATKVNEKVGDVQPEKEALPQQQK